ncbi:hypothetical protein HMPREF3190_00536 [Umbribacter vaginalis]|nr:hypothetical protein HMPREF3190_00536 [Coriobacteriales bacterium DNF00809]
MQHGTVVALECGFGMLLCRYSRYCFIFVALFIFCSLLHSNF